MNNMFKEMCQNRIIKMILLPVIPCLIIYAGCGRNHVSSLEVEFYPQPVYEPEPVFAELVVEDDGPFTISVGVSRSSGVAPLSVFFDATGTTGLADDGFFSNNAAYMDATFVWDFGDTASRYNNASGFVAAHVFENPGTYMVHLDVYDAAGDTGSADITITVSEFDGTTYYVANADHGGSDFNMGSIDEPFETPEHALSSDILDADVRVLFKTGDYFEISNMIVISDKTGPIIIGAYTDPDDLSTDRPIIHTTAVDSDWSTIHFWDCSDIRIMDIAVTATAESGEDPRYPFGIGWGNSCSHMLKYRTEEYQNGGMSMSPGGTFTTVAECEFHDTTQTGYTSSGPNVGNALIGNWVHDKNMVDESNEEHVFRLQGGSRYFIAHNTFGPNIIVNYDALTIRGNSEMIVIYKNKIEGWVQGIWPQNRNSAREYQRYCIMDSNLIIGQHLVDGGGDRQGAVGIHAKDIVIRNNIIYDYQRGIGIGDDTVVGPSQRIKIYNNTFINPTADSTFNPIHVDENCFDINVKNNLMLDLAGSDLFYTSFLEVWGGSVFHGESDDNMFYGSTWAAEPDLFGSSTLTQWQSTTGNDENSSIENPQLISTDYTDADFCKPQTGSPVINAGEFTPAALDYNGTLRDSSRDIGACEYN